MSNPVAPLTPTHQINGASVGSTLPPEGLHVTDVIVYGNDIDGYWVQFADFQKESLGPFDRHAYAAGVAHSVAWQLRGRVWLARDNAFDPLL